MEQRFTFDKVADLYDAARPGYPPALFDELAAAVGLKPGDRVLEVGAGTGKATEGFARRGLRVLALEPGRDLIRVARSSLAAYPDIEFSETTLEAWPLQEGAFKLVAAAQSWHWIAPEISFAKAAAALAPGGVLAVFGNAPMPLEPPLGDEIELIHQQLAPALGGASAELAYLPDGPFGPLFDQSGLFEPVTHKSYLWSRIHTSARYADLLCTLSRYQLLEEAHRRELLTAIADAIDAGGGRLELRYQAHLYWAARKA